ncbi:MAG TPA: TetR/AcrR family transcriptional regulator [Acidobacteriaceae bacterium]|nr:TetR/AcrR family transcriptional regulator [Acidobacteriaceae bacterium]
MTPVTQKSSKERLLDAAIYLFRSRGYTATRVDDICEYAGLTKGSFFHHFSSKEDLARASIRRWEQLNSSASDSTLYRFLPDPLDRVLGYVDFRKSLLRGDLPEYTCLIGTLLQEIYMTHPVLRQICDESISEQAAHLEADIAAAMRLRGLQTSWTAASLALHIEAVLQGSFILAKAKDGPSAAVACLDHLHRFLTLLFA